MFQHATRLLAAIALLAAAGAHAAGHVRWFTLSSNGQRTGFVREESGGDASGSEVSERIVLFVRQLERVSRLERRVALRRGADGRPLEFDYLATSGTTHENWHGKFSGDTLHIEPAGGPAQDAALPDDTVFTPERSERYAALWKMQQDAATLTVFDPARRSAGVLRVRRVADDAGAAALHLRVDGGAAGGGEDLWLDSQGTVQRIENTAFGARLVWTPCTGDCEAAPEHPIELLQNWLVASPVAIPAAGKHRTLRYVLARRDGARLDLPATPEQGVTRTGAHAVVTVCGDCGAAEPASADELAQYLRPNAWVQSDAPEIRALALGAVPRDARTDYRMQKLVNVVMREMKGDIDLVGYADARTALRTGAGDCTEFAVLLAALARAQGIPTRVIAGMAYAERFEGRVDVFVPHLWVQAWDGTRWRSYDAALGEFDATHIALAIGSGAPDEFERVVAELPALTIEKAGMVADRPAEP